MKRFRPGLSIIELMLIVAILGIIASITIVAYEGVRAKTETQRNYNRAMQIITIAEGLDPDPTVTNKTVIGGKRPIYSSTEVQSALNNYASICRTNTTSNANWKACPLILPLKDDVRTNIVTDFANPPNESRPNALRYSSCALSGQVVGFRILYWDYTKKTTGIAASGQTTGAGVSCY